MDQKQHDVFGEIVDCAYQWSSRGGEIRPALWSQLMPLLDGAAREWRQLDHGIWEVRRAGRPFTYSAAGAFLLCSFWLVDHLTAQGRVDEALSLYKELCAARARSACCRSRSSRRLAPSSGTFPRRSAMSGSSPAA